MKITRAPTSWSRSFRSGLRTTSNDTSTHIVEFIEELPKTTTGKIQRFKLREPESGKGMPQQDDELSQRETNHQQKDELV